MNIGAALSDFLETVQTHGPYVARGLWVTLELTVVGMVLGLIFGLILALMLIAKNRITRFAARAYVEIIRGTPPLVQLFFAYFGLATLGVVLPGVMAAALTFGAITAAYVAEILRAGINGVDFGQTEAAQGLGMDYRTRMRYVIIPQAGRLVLPPLTNEAITLLKSTSLVVTIGIPDVTFRAYDVASKTFNSLPILLFAGILYFGVAYPVSLAVRRMESRLSYDRQGAK